MTTQTTLPAERRRQLLEATGLGRAALSEFAWNPEQHRDAHGRWASGAAVDTASPLAQAADKTADGRTLAGLVEQAVGFTDMEVSLGLRRLQRSAEIDPTALAITADKLEDVGLAATAAAIHACLADRGGDRHAVNALLRAAHAELARYGVGAANRATVVGHAGGDMLRVASDREVGVAVHDDATGARAHYQPVGAIPTLQTASRGHTMPPDLTDLSPAALGMLALQRAVEVADPADRRAAELDDHQGLLRGTAAAVGNGIYSFRDRSRAERDLWTGSRGYQNLALGDAVIMAGDQEPTRRHNGDLAFAPFRLFHPDHGDLAIGRVIQNPHGHETLHLTTSRPGRPLVGRRLFGLLGILTGQAAARGARSLAVALLPEQMQHENWDRVVAPLLASGAASVRRTDAGSLYTFDTLAACSERLLDRSVLGPVVHGHGDRPGVQSGRRLAMYGIIDEAAPGPVARVTYAVPYNSSSRRSRQPHDLATLAEAAGTGTATLRLTAGKRPLVKQETQGVLGRALHEAALRGITSVAIKGEARHSTAILNSLVKAKVATRQAGGGVLVHDVPAARKLIEEAA